MDTETAQEMRQGEWYPESRPPAWRACVSCGMTALLNDVVGELGQVKAAEGWGSTARRCGGA